MKPLPNLDDTAAMLERGRRSTLAAARNEAEAALRDAYTALTGAKWDVYGAALLEVRKCIARLRWIDRQWQRLDKG